MTPGPYNVRHNIGLILAGVIVVLGLAITVWDAVWWLLGKVF